MKNYNMQEYLDINYPEESKERVFVAITKALQSLSNAPSSPRELAQCITKNKFTLLGGSTPYATVSSCISKYFKRFAKTDSQKHPILVKHSDNNESKKSRYNLSFEFYNHCLESSKKDSIESSKINKEPTSNSSEINGRRTEHKKFKTENYVGVNKNDKLEETKKHSQKSLDSYTHKLKNTNLCLSFEPLIEKKVEILLTSDNFKSLKSCDQEYKNSQLNISNDVHVQSPIIINKEPPKCGNHIAPRKLSEPSDVVLSYEELYTLLETEDLSIRNTPEIDSKESHIEDRINSIIKNIKGTSKTTSKINKKSLRCSNVNFAKNEKTELSRNKVGFSKFKYFKITIEPFTVCTIKTKVCNETIELRRILSLNQQSSRKLRKDIKHFDESYKDYLKLEDLISLTTKLYPNYLFPEIDDTQKCILFENKINYGGYWIPLFLAKKCLKDAFIETHDILKLLLCSNIEDNLNKQLNPFSISVLSDTNFIKELDISKYFDFEKCTQDSTFDTIEDTRFNFVPYESKSPDEECHVDLSVDIKSCKDTSNIKLKSINGVLMYVTQLLSVPGNEPYKNCLIRRVDTDYVNASLFAESMGINKYHVFNKLNIIKKKYSMNTNDICKGIWISLESVSSVLDDYLFQKYRYFFDPRLIEKFHPPIININRSFSAQCLQLLMLKDYVVLPAEEKRRSKKTQDKIETGSDITVESSDSSLDTENMSNNDNITDDKTKIYVDNTEYVSNNRYSLQQQTPINRLTEQENYTNMHEINRLSIMENSFEDDEVLTEEDLKSHSSICYEEDCSESLDICGSES